MGSPLSPTSNSHTINQNPNETSISNPTSPVTDKHKAKNGVVSIGEIEITNGDTWIGSDEAPSPVQPPSSASSGFSDDDSLHGDLGLQAVSMEQLIEAIHSRGRAGLVADYVEIKQRPLDGSFNNAKYVEYRTSIIFFSKLYRLKPFVKNFEMIGLLCSTLGLVSLQTTHCV